jgi:hypothetical protein
MLISLYFFFSLLYTDRPQLIAMYQSILNLLKNLRQGNYQQLAADFEPEYFKLISKSGGILSVKSLSNIHAAL